MCSLPRTSTAREVERIAVGAMLARCKHGAGGAAVAGGGAERIQPPPLRGFRAMIIPAVTFYDVVLTVHILAVVVAFGVVFAYPVIDAYVRSSMPANLAALHRLHVALARRVITPAMVVVLLAGLYLAIDRWSLGDPWISATFAILFVLFGLTGAFLIPADTRLAELAERDAGAGGGPSADYDAARRRADAIGGLALLLVVVAIFLMVAKPGA